MSDKKNDDSGYNIARLIKEKRPHLNIKSYIQDRVAQEKFEEWMKSYKTSQASRQINQKEWKDQEGEDDGENKSNYLINILIIFQLSAIAIFSKI